MLDVVHHLAAGFIDVLVPANLASLVIGLIVGMLVAVLPGLTLVMGVVLALPFTYGMSITPSIILLTAMYVSGTYGGRDHVDPVPHSRRADGRAPAVGRLRDGACRGPRAGAGLDTVRSADRRPDHRDDHGDAGGAVRQDRADLRFARILRDRPVRFHERRRTGRRIARERVHQPLFRHARSRRSASTKSTASTASRSAAKSCAMASATCR